MKKIILILLLVLVVALVIGVVFVGSHLGDIVKAAMETVGPKVTQTTLKVDAVKVSLLSGSAGVQGLVLGNPEGYQAPSSISVGKAAVSLTPGSLLADKIIIRSVEVRDAEITFEGNPLGANNLTKLMDNVNALTPAASKAATNAPAPGEKKPAKKLQVDDFLIAGAKVHAHISGIPGLAPQEITVPIPDIHFTDLGKGNDGITAADLTQKILHEITAATIKALTAAATNLGKDALDAAKNIAQDALNGTLTNGDKAVSESVNKLKKGLGGLLGK